MPSPPDSESPGPVSVSEISFPGLADMRAGAGIANAGELAMCDPSKEEKKIQVNFDISSTRGGSIRPQRELTLQSA